MMLITKILNKTVGEDNRKTEMYCTAPFLSIMLVLLIDTRFMTANRAVRTGLTASAVVSVCRHNPHKVHIQLMW